MRCPYRKKVKVYPDGLGRVSEVEFMECEREACPYWGTAVYNESNGNWVYGCRKAEKECSWMIQMQKG